MCIYGKDLPISFLLHLNILRFTLQRQAKILFVKYDNAKILKFRLLHL